MLPPNEPLATPERTEPQIVLSQKELLEYVAKVEERLLKNQSEFNSHLNRRIQEYDNRLSVAERSRLHEEMATFNAIAKHLNMIEAQLDERMQRVDSFLRGLHDLEMRKGTSAVYDDVLMNLRLDHTAFSKSFVTLQQVRMQCDQVITRLQAQEE